MGAGEYFAHTNGTPDQAHWQPLREHLLNVAKLARQFAEEGRLGGEELAEAAYAPGVLHDLGKSRGTA